MFLLLKYNKNYLIMSKSTPLSQFTGVGETNPINDMEMDNSLDKENQLVEEILTEINNDPNENTQNLMMELNDIENEEPKPPQYSEPEEVKPTAEELSATEPSELRPLVDEDEESLKSIQDELLSRIKLPLLAGAVVVLFSVPSVSDILIKLIPKKELFTKNMNLMILVVKFILSSILFMGLQFAL